MKLKSAIGTILLGTLGVMPGMVWAAVQPSTTTAATQSSKEEAHPEDLEKRHQEAEKAIRAKIDEIDKKIDQLTRQSAKTEERAKQRIQGRIERLRKMKPVLSSQLADLHLAWQDLKSTLSKVSQDLQETLNKIEESQDLEQKEK